MKKIMLFLAIFLGYFLLEMMPVNAASAQFYEAEYIPNVYVVRQQGGKKYYQQGRVFRNVETNEVAYCLQPFSLFDKNAIYEQQDLLSSIDSEKLNKVKETVALGYPYVFSNLEYYMATQMRIWQIMEPDCQFYYTEGLNGPKTIAQDHWFQKLDDMLKAYSKSPEFHGKIFETTTNGSISVPYLFSSIYETVIETELSYTKNGDRITFSNLQPGTYQVKVQRNFKPVSQKPILFYYHQQSQLLVNRGNPQNQVYQFQIKVVDTSITVKKIDKDTESKIPSGEANLEGASFTLFNEKKEKLATITFDSNLEKVISVKEGNVSYLPYGTYFLKEETAGVGYLCNKEEFEIHLNKSQPNIVISLKNQVIKNKVSIHKLFGTQEKLQSEANVIFEIYDSKDNLFKIIQTDQTGKVEFDLPYGTYRIHQKNSKEGYQKVEDFEVIVQEEKKEHHFVLLDEELPHIEIEVPNTKTSSINLFPFLFLLLGGIYVKKKMVF